MSESLFADIAAYSVIIPFITFFLLKQKNNKITRAVFALICLSIATEIITEFVIRSGYIGTFLFNLFYVAQFLFISYIYKFHLLVGKYSGLINSAVLLFLAFFMVVTAFVKQQNIHIPQNWVWTIGNVIIVIYGVLHYFYLRKTVEREPPIHTYGQLWITIAFLTYFTYAIGFFYVADKVYTYDINLDTALLIWDFHNGYYIIKNLLLTYAMHLLSREQERVRFPFKKLGVAEEWWKTMKPNPNKKTINPTSEEEV